MKDDDYDYFGKGFEGYSHYMQTFESTHKKSSKSSPKKTVVDEKNEENQQTNNESSTSLAQKVVILICFFLFHVAFVLFFACISSGNPGAMLVGVLICLVCIAVSVLLIKIFF